MKKLLLLNFTILLLLSACDSNKEPEPVDCNSSDLALVIGMITDATNCENPNGEIVVNASGGTSPYMYKLNSADFQTSNTFENLSAGTYTITVKDDSDCEISIEGVVESSGSSLEIINVTSTDAGCGTSNASITVEATGDGTIQYKLDNGSYQSGNSFENIAAGNHELTLLDDSGCETKQNVDIKNGTSFQSQIKAIVSANCAVSGCHNGSNSALPNFNIFQNFQSRASTVKQYTQAGIMPPDGRTITQEEKDLIACWVDDGALNN